MLLFNPAIGEPFRLEPTDPAAGAEWTQLLANDFIYQILSIGYTLVTDANAGNRNSTLLLEWVSPDDIMRVANHAAHAASLSRNYTWLSGVGNSLGTTATAIQQGLPTPLFLSGNTLIQTVTDNIQVGDQYSAIYIYGMRWRFQTI